MSPTVHRENGYRFFFFSREESRIHIHVVSGEGEAKFWLKPEIELAKNYRYSRKQLKEIELIIEAHYVEEQSENHFYWADIDVDLTREMIEHPDRFPLKAKIT